MRRLLLGLAAVLAACGTSGDDSAGTVATVTSSDEPVETTTPSPTTPRVVVSPPTTPPTSSGPAVPATLPPGTNDLERAIADVVARVGVDPAAVTVVVQDEVTWRDSSVGCPQKGMEYLQVLTDGRRIILDVEGRQFHYHAGGQRELFYCAIPQPPVGE